MNKQDEIISLQNLIIERYEDILKFLNNICMDRVRYQKNLQKGNDTRFNEDLMNFAWATNDYIVDQPFINLLKLKLDELMKGE